jgi:hypothetical protein
MSGRNCAPQMEFHKRGCQLDSGRPHIETVAAYFSSLLGGVMPEVQVWYDGIMWVARRAGFAGKVFGDTEAQALRRAEGWDWNHWQPLELPVVPKKRRKP